MGQNNSRKTGNRPQGEQKNKFWDIVPGTEGKPPEILLYGTISRWEDKDNDNTVTPKQFSEDFDALGDVPEIIVRINSGGGDVFAATAIFTKLKSSTAKITVKIDGWAASAATIIAMAGDTVQIARNSVFMIHDPSMVVFGSFQAGDFEKMAGELKVVKQSIVNAYWMKTKKDTGDIADLMAEETWLTGDEAVEEGFCDELMFEEAQTVVEDDSKVVVNGVEMDISGFKNFPDVLLDIWEKNEKPINNNIPDGREPENKPKREERTMEPKDIKTVDGLKAAYPDLTAAIENSATEKERSRIKELQAAAVGGFEDIVNEAMFDKPVSAGEMALKILMKQKEQGGQYMTDRTADVADSNVNSVGAGAGERGGEAEDPYNAAIDRLFPDAK